MKKYMKLCCLLVLIILILMIIHSFCARKQEILTTNDLQDEQSQLDNIEIKSEEYSFPEEVDTKIDLYDISNIKVFLGTTTYEGLEFYMGIDHKNNLQIYYYNGKNYYTLVNVNLYSDDESIEYVISENKDLNRVNEFKNALSHDGITFSLLYGSHAVYTIYIALETDGQPYTLLYDIVSGSLIENDIDDDNTNELFAAFGGYFYYLLDNQIYKGTYILGEDIQYSYFDEKLEQFNVYFSDGTSAKYIFNHDLTFLIPVL